jgi:hypothetical protein
MKESDESQTPSPEGYEFGEALRFAATLIPVERVRVALLGDGAPWLWPHLQAAFPTGKEILDYYHCAERVHHVAR